MAFNSFDNTYPAFPILALLCFLLVLIPLPWHLRAWNAGTCLFMIWTAIACLNQFINSIIWHGNVIDWAPIWCDISTRLSVGIAVALPAASLCINRRLYKIATCQVANITIAHKKRAALVDIAIGLGIPALQMALQFIVQGHRYDIWEDIGCFPTTFNTPPAYPLSFVWPNVISLVSAFYCILTLKSFVIRRAQFGQIISSSFFSVSQYFRLMGLASCEIVFTIPISTYALYLNITSSPIYPWISWSDTHFDWYHVDEFPALLWQSNRYIVMSLELNRWSIILCAIVFFAFFGFAEEARKHYRRAFSVVANRFGCNSAPRRKIEITVFKHQDTPNATMKLPMYTPSQSPSSITQKYSLSTSMTSMDSLQKQPSFDRDYAQPVTPSLTEDSLISRTLVSSQAPRCTA